MKALDTNVLIRFLVRDDEKQARAVYRIFKQAEQRKDTLFVPQVVILEIVWVLESVYGISREEILEAFESLLLMPVLAFEGQPAIRRFVTAAKASKVDLADLLIAASAISAGCDSVLTFDKAAISSVMFEPVK